MKICIIVDDYLPHSIKVGAKMMHELSVELKKNGNDVLVITPGSNIDEDFQSYELDGIKVLKFSSGEIKNVSKIKRAVNESLLSYNAWRFLKKQLRANRQDFIVYYSPSIFWGLLVLKLKRIWSAKSYLILRDFFPQWVIDNGMLKENSLITKYFRYFEKINYLASDRIGIQSPANIVEFKKKNSDQYQIDLLYNWASDNPVIASDYPYRKKLQIENKIVFFYGGNIGHAQDMENILILARNLLEYKDIYFVLVGAGDEVELVKKRIIDYSLTNMTLLDPVSQDEFKNLLSEFDVGLFSLHKDHTSHNFPGKVLGYMVQSMPILGCVNPGNDLKAVVETANAGFVSTSGDETAFKENAIRLVDSNLRKKMGENSKKLLMEKFSVTAAVHSILNITNSP